MIDLITLLSISFFIFALIARFSLDKSTPQILLFFIFLFPLILFICAMIKGKEHLKRKGPIRKIVFNKMDEKYWMWFGVGGFYAAIYALIYTYIPNIDAELFSSGLKYGLKHPTSFLYFGALIVVGNSFLVIAVRFVVKYLYILRNL